MSERHSLLKLYARWKFTVLLVSMFLLMVVRMSSHGAAGSQIAIDLCGSLVVLAGVLAACTHRRTKVAAIMLALPPLAMTLFAQLDAPEMEATTFVLLRATTALFLGFLFLGFMILTIIAELLRQRDISRDTLSGAFCGYLLIGMVWTELFLWIDLVIPGAFSTSQPGLTGHGIEPPSRPLHYFSFVTLTTVGYGDIVAISPLARMLACLEAICAQFYLAVLVAGLVSIRISQLAPPTK
jgi:hypothetical protein